MSNLALHIKFHGYNKINELINTFSKKQQQQQHFIKTKRGKKKIPILHLIIIMKPLWSKHYRCSVSRTARNHISHHATQLHRGRALNARHRVSSRAAQFARALWTMTAREDDVNLDKWVIKHQYCAEHCFVRFFHNKHTEYVDSYGTREIRSR